ncbi:hypothetical protein RI367_005051 [Sorochytrium milnesiophthora]
MAKFLVSPRKRIALLVGAALLILGYSQLLMPVEDETKGEKKKQTPKLPAVPEDDEQSVPSGKVQGPPTAADVDDSSENPLLDMPVAPVKRTMRSSSYMHQIYYRDSTAAQFGKSATAEKQPLWSDLPARDRPLLVCVAIKDGTSYGQGRSFRDAIAMIVPSLPDPKMATFAVLVSDKEEFKAIDDYFNNAEELPFAAVELYMPVPGSLNEQLNVKFDRQNRQNDNVQIPRRRTMAVLRNMLMNMAMNPQYAHVLWFDSDVIKIPADLAEKAMASNRDIVVPACYKNGVYYDWNTFVGERTRPGPNDAVPDLKGQIPAGKNLYVARHVPGKSWVLADQKFANEQWVELTAVGGTWLLMSAEVVLAGVNFGITNVVGTTWDSLGGYDAIETESICYMAKSIGKKCWGMPQVHIHHSPQ